jgi:alcohol dehydrogenase YqhD (iron-dependent ADH family)
MNDFTFQNSTKVYFGRNQLTPSDVETIYRMCL